MNKWSSYHWRPARAPICRLTGCLAAASREDGLCSEHGVIQDAMRVAAVGFLANDLRMAHAGFMGVHR